ncbi:MAG: cyclic nucleotide-binding domain-containing protein [Bdellovibrionota bacterium]
MAETSELIRKFRNPQWGATQLRRVAILQGLTDNELLELYQLGKIRSLNAKVNAVIEGEPTRGLYILLYGRVSIYKTDKTTGSMHRLTFLEEGSIFGELSLFDNAPRSATVTTESPCHLFYLDAENFLRYLDSKGDAIKTRFYKQCAEDLADRFRNQNSDYIQAQKLLWQYALRKTNPQESDHSKKSCN